MLWFLAAFALALALPLIPELRRRVILALLRRALPGSQLGAAALDRRGQIILRQLSLQPAGDALIAFEELSGPASFGLLRGRLGPWQARGLRARGLENWPRERAEPGPSGRVLVRDARIDLPGSAVLDMPEVELELAEAHVVARGQGTLSLPKAVEAIAIDGRAYLDETSVELDLRAPAAVLIDSMRAFIGSDRWRALGLDVSLGEAKAIELSLAAAREPRGWSLTGGRLRWGEKELALAGRWSEVDGLGIGPLTAPEGELLAAVLAPLIRRAPEAQRPLIHARLAEAALDLALGPSEERWRVAASLEAPGLTARFEPKEGRLDAGRFAIELEPARLIEGQEALLGGWGLGEETRLAFVGRLGSDGVSGSLSAASFGLREPHGAWYRGQEAAAEVAARNGRLELQDLRAVFLGGRVRGSAWLRPEARTFSAQLDFDELALGDWPTGPEKRLGAVVSGRARGHLGVAGRLGALETVEGEGHLALADAAYPVIEGLRDKAELLGLPLPHHEGSGEASAALVIQAGGFALEDIDAPLEGLRISGRWGFDRRRVVDGVFELAIAAALMARSPLLVLPAAVASGPLRLKLIAHGSLGQPKLRADTSVLERWGDLTKAPAQLLKKWLGKL